MTTYLPALMSSIGQESFDRQIDRMFDEAVRSFSKARTAWAPACNAWEDDHGFYVQVALPGWEAKDVSIEVENRVLTVKGERKDEETPGRTVHVWEVTGDQFVRSFRLPTFVDHNKASASHKNGLLTITFPKLEEAKPRRIAIAAE
jgi:HSP20 family protein